jgi:tRNA(fMet)-specific endonuclease VapC
MIIADTDVLIDFLRGQGDGAKRVAIELTTRSLATTAVTAFELRAGARTPRQQKAMETLLAAMSVLPFGTNEAAAAGRLQLELEGSGQTIGMADTMIAATCLVAKGVLLTRNVKHFERVKGLKLSGRWGAAH